MQLNVNQYSIQCFLWLLLPTTSGCGIRVVKVHSRCDGNDKINQFFVFSIPVHDNNSNGRNRYHGDQLQCSHCQSPLRTDTNLQIVVENSFLLLHQGMYLLSDIEYLWLPYCSWIWSWFTEFTEFRESHLWKTQLFQPEGFSYNLTVNVSKVHVWKCVENVCNTFWKHIEKECWQL